ncbi:MAG: LegC family aminotransferase [Candidatus Krumholzibacteriota bacterium]|nr:LegC family aminotransferase [Candidatus Krumholzibacteriota bacterium]
MSDFIPLSVPSIQGNEWKYVKECLDTEWVSSVGSYVDLFEKNIREYTGAKFSTACVNGTSALQVALRILDVVPGDEVIVPTITFIAPVNVIVYLGAEPVFMDCDDYYNIDVEKTIGFLKNETEFKKGHTWNKKTGRRIKAIIPVHIFGNAVDLTALVDICDRMNIELLEDASESLGSRYIEGPFDGRHTGTIGAMGVYSFNGNKIITTGAGGMLVTNDSKYADRARYLTTQAKDDAVRYVHNEVGYNFRMSNIQAAMGVAQLENLDRYIEIKRAGYEKYRELISGIEGLTLAPTPSYASSNYWFYSLQIDAGIYGRDRESLMAYLSTNRVQTRPVWFPNHLQKPFISCQNYRIEKAPELLDKTLNIPCSTNLSHDDIRRIVDLLGS